MQNPQVIATSANVANEMKELKGKYQQKELAGIAHVSRASIGHYFTGERNMPAEIMSSLTDNLCENILAVKMLNKFSNYVLPFADRINAHPLIFSVIAEKEEREESKEANKVASLLAKVNGDISQQERLEIKNYISELLDSVFIDNSLLAALCDDYNYNLADIITERTEHWKDLGYLK